MIYLTSGYEPIDRGEIQSRSEPRDDCRGLERLLISPLGVDWTLRPDRRDVRRWYALDIHGAVQMHAAWPQMLRELSRGVPQALGRRHW